MCVLVLVWRIKKQNIYLLKINQARDFMINDFIRYLVEGSKIVDNTKFFGENEVGAWTLDDMDKDMDRVTKGQSTIIAIGLP